MQSLHLATVVARRLSTQRSRTVRAAPPATKPSKSSLGAKGALRLSIANLVAFQSLLQNWRYATTR